MSHCEVYFAFESEKATSFLCYFSNTVTTDDKQYLDARFCQGGGGGAVWHVFKCILFRRPAVAVPVLAVSVADTRGVSAVAGRPCDGSGRLQSADAALPHRSGGASAAVSAPDRSGPSPGFGHQQLPRRHWRDPGQPAWPVAWSAVVIIIKMSNIFQQCLKVCTCSTYISLLNFRF